MNILIICSYFPPDSVIAAIRPYMLAKYLSKTGNKITVLRSGDIWMPPDDSLPQLENVDVISFLGDDSDAEKNKRGEYEIKESPKQKFPWINKRIRYILENIYHIVMKPLRTRDYFVKVGKYYNLQKKALDEMRFQNFDIIFSTFAEVENIFAGGYAKKIFHAKWIADFRDSVFNFQGEYDFLWNLRAKKIVMYALENADACTTVSCEITKELMSYKPEAHIETVYNGYDNITYHEVKKNKSKIFSICYTGQIYGTRLKALKELGICLKKMIDNNLILPEKIKFVYAGISFENVVKIFRDNNIENILENKGYVTRAEANDIQIQSDIFLVLSWNTKKRRGILTGKFYEGMRAKKPILSVVSGNVPQSELYLLNEKYHYGYCYEPCSGDYSGLIKYIKSLYDEKINTGGISYEQNEELIKNFRYDYIAHRLEMLCNEIVHHE